MADGNSMTDSSATHGSVTQRRALAALILAASERNGAGYGTRLPTERQLAVDLGVSRSAIRHAMAELQAQGRHPARWAEVRSCACLLPTGRTSGRRMRPCPGGDSGRRGRVGRGLPFPIPDSVRPLCACRNVMAVRRLFEPTAMSLVVAWATARDFAEMELCLRGGSGRLITTSSRSGTPRCTGRSSRRPAARASSAVRGGGAGAARVWGDLKRRSASAARRDEYRRDHEEIVTALRLRDADRATAAMRTHLARVSRHLLGTG